MPVQQTFTLVPRNPAPAAATTTRPMTSKQVKKAHAANSRGPKLSRVEQRKADLAEQQRIRKEIEKDRQAARARAARERKKDKELAANEAKKKSGKPTVTVRPSQDTIARFVRGDGSGRKRDGGGAAVESMGAVMEEVEEAVKGVEEKDDVKMDLGEASRKIPEEVSEEAYEKANEETTIMRDTEEDTATEPIDTKLLMSSASSHATEADQPVASHPPSSPNMPDRGIQEPGTSFASMFDDLDDETLQNVLEIEDAIRNQPPWSIPRRSQRLQSKSSAVAENIEETSIRFEGDQLPFDLLDSISSFAPEDSAPSANEEKVPEEDLFDEMDDITEEEIRMLTSPMKPAEDRTSESPASSPIPAKETKPPSPRVQRTFSSDPLEDDIYDDFFLGISTQVALQPSKPTLHPPQFKKPQPPPPKLNPPSFKLPNLPAAADFSRKRPRRSPYEEDLGLAPKHPRHNPPPMSTQAILVNLDDFFPSPSQQARELLDEEPAPSPCPIPKPAKPTPSPHSSKSGTPVPSPPKKRWFTSSGSNEHYLLALQRSKREAAMEDIHRKERERMEAGLVIERQRVEEERRSRKMAPPPKPAVKPAVRKGSQVMRSMGTPSFIGRQSSALQERVTTNTPKNSNITLKPTPSPRRIISSKPQPSPLIHHINPPHQPPSQKPPPPKSSAQQPCNKENIPPTSQESDYGGAWIDDIDPDLMV